jgi:excisionase family DNA binding protein
MTNAILLDEAELVRIVKEANRELLQEIRFTTPEPDLPEILNLELAAQILNRSKSWLYKAVMTNKIPYKKFGSHLVFNRTEVVQWMEANTHNPKQEAKTKLNYSLHRSATKKADKI